jgi:hypothetical protein
MPTPKWEKLSEIESKVEARVDLAVGKARSNKKTWLLFALATVALFVAGWFWG